jgi:hypothetical protein
MMVSPLQRVPHNILFRIAFLSASSTIFDPLTDILHLSLTCRDIHDSLSVKACPQLYANLLQTRFDTAAALRRFRSVDMLTSSSLCAEFVQRCRVLQRVRRGDISTTGLAQDLFTAAMMVLESDGLNEMQLSAVAFPQFISKLLRNRLPKAVECIPFANEIDSLAIWLLWLTLSRRASPSAVVSRRSTI